MSAVQDGFPINPIEVEKAEAGDVTVMPRLLTRVRLLSKQNLRYRLIEICRRITGSDPNAEASYAMWHATQKGPEQITEREATELDALAYEAQHWCLFFNDADPDNDAKFIPLNEWESMYARWKHQNGL